MHYTDLNTLSIAELPNGRVINVLGLDATISWRAGDIFAEFSWPQRLKFLHTPVAKIILILNYIISSNQNISTQLFSFNVLHLRVFQHCNILLLLMLLLLLLLHDAIFRIRDRFNDKFMYIPHIGNLVSVVSLRC